MTPLQKRIRTGGGKTEQKGEDRNALSWTLPSRLDVVDGLCLETRSFLEDHGLAGSVFTVDLLLRECLNNAIQHGNGGIVDKKVQVTIRLKEKWIILTVADEGEGFDWRTVRELPPDKVTTGRGLVIAEQYAQRVRFNPAGNRIALWVSRPVEKEVWDMTGHQIERNGAQSKVILGDKLTAMDLPDLQPVLKEGIETGVREIVFDMGRTMSIDSTGIGLLIATNNSLLGVQGSMKIWNVTKDIYALLQSMRLVDRLHVSAAEGREAHG